MSIGGDMTRAMLRRLNLARARFCENPPAPRHSLVSWRAVTSPSSAWRVALLTATLATVGSGGCSDDESAAAGELRGDCLANLACRSGLECSMNSLTCIDPAEIAESELETSGSGLGLEGTGESATTMTAAATTGTDNGSQTTSGGQDDGSGGTGSSDPCAEFPDDMVIRGGVDIELSGRRMQFITARSRVHYRASKAAMACVQAVEVELSSAEDCRLQVRARDVVNDERDSQPQLTITDLRWSVGPGCADVNAADYGEYAGYAEDVAGSWLELPDANIQRPATSPSCMPAFAVGLHLEGVLRSQSTGRPTARILASDLEVSAASVTLEALGACPVQCSEDGHCRGDRICGDDRSCQGCAACAASEICVGDRCESVVCEANGHRCDGPRLLACDELGTMERELESCDTEALCDADAGRCMHCTPGEVRCRGDWVEACADDGLSWLIEEHCRIDQRCASDTASCVELVCEPGRDFCSGPELRRCDADGSDFSIVETCDAGEICQAHLGRCAPQLCQPSSYFCVNEKRHRCDASGSASTMIEDCIRNSELRQCHYGACLPDRFSEVGGESEERSEYAFTVGNLYEASERTTLYGFDVALDVNVDVQELLWMVYERNNDGDSTYRRVAEAQTVVDRGRGWYRSPPMNVWLDSGHRYLLAVTGRHGVAGNVRSFTLVSTATGDDGGQPVRFGQMLSSHAWPSVAVLGDSTQAQILVDATVGEVAAQRVYTAR